MILRITIRFNEIIVVNMHYCVNAFQIQVKFELEAILKSILDKTFDSCWKILKILKNYKRKKAT